jgi:TerC family integral membrane protein
VTHDPGVWLVFGGAVVGLLALDLGVLNRRPHRLSTREAVAWSAGIVTLAFLFGLWLYFRLGRQTALEYYAGYLTELALSVDNLFVFLILFQYFAVPENLQPRVLKWGIFGAMVLRGIMIAAGAFLIQQLTWIIYIFGAILVVTGIRMFRHDDAKVDPEHNPLVRLAMRFVPVTRGYQGQRFFVISPEHKLMATPLFLVLLAVEWSDLVFAIDSIPAVFGVTRDPFVVYSSNLFAILGLRALFFALAGSMDRFSLLKPAVSLILVFVGTKMVVSHWVHLPILASLGVIVGLLIGAVLLSMFRKEAPTNPN